MNFETFNYKNAKMGCIIRWNLNNTNFSGVSVSSVNSRLSADIYYRPPNLREVYVPFTENIRNPTKGGQSSHSLWNEDRSSKLSEAIFMNW